MRTQHRRLAAALTLPILLVPLAACSKDSSTTAAAASSTTAGTSPGTTTKTTAPGTTMAGGYGSSGTTPGTAMAGKVEIKVVTTPYGKALANGEGLVLYAWEKDTAGSTSCTSAGCVAKWPPVVATSMADVTVDAGVVDAMHFTLIARPDGTQQVALDGRPLHTMSADAPGEANCQGLDGWYLQTPEGGWNKNTAAN